LTEDLMELLNRIGRPEILVIGDLILDEYIWGEVDRISPEAPIQVLRVSKEEVRLGGAGSVIHNLVALGSDVTACGVLGDDDNGKRFKAELEKLGVRVDGLVIDPARITTVKTRMIGRVQHMLRVDKEDTSEISPDIIEKLGKFLSKGFAEYDIVLVSDYDKGLLCERILKPIFSMCQRAGKPVVLDPARGVDFLKYRGAAYVTPNRAEAELASGVRISDERDARSAAEILVEKLGLQGVVITLDRQGMVFLDRGGNFFQFPTRPRYVYDVTGAGDMVMSIFGFVLAGGGAPQDAVELANVAGGAEVEKIGVTPLSRKELQRELMDEHFLLSTKIKDTSDLEAALRDHRKMRKRIVFTNGCFDLLHVGHIKFLQFARHQGDVLVVGLNSDESVSKIKGPGRPILAEKERANILAALECVDYITIFDEETPVKLIERVKPDVLVKGEDWRDKGVVGQDFVESRGGRVVLAPLVEGASTTNIVEKILQKYGQTPGG